MKSYKDNWKNVIFTISNDSFRHKLFNPTPNASTAFYGKAFFMVGVPVYSAPHPPHFQHPLYDGHINIHGEQFTRNIDTVIPSDYVRILLIGKMYII